MEEILKKTHTEKVASFLDFLNSFDGNNYVIIENYTRCNTDCTDGAGPVCPVGKKLLRILEDEKCNFNMAAPWATRIFMGLQHVLELPAVEYRHGCRKRQFY